MYDKFVKVDFDIMLYNIGNVSTTKKQETIMINILKKNNIKCALKYL